METTTSIPVARVLSIQSHVVGGYCGNKSATFPLQLLGLEVDVLNSVQLSNHTQYKTTRGQIFDDKDLEEIYRGLKENGFLQLYDHILTGYVADVSYIKTMAKMIANIKQEREKLHLDCWYTFDPVLGDDGIGFYVPSGESIAAAYKDYLLPLADIITPNRFEASTLTGIDIDPSSKEALKQACEAIRVFHTMGVKVVVITSFETPDCNDHLTILLSRKSSDFPEEGDKLNINQHYVQHKHSPNVWLIRVPKIGATFCGTGDLFAALLTGWIRKTNFDFKKSLEYTINSMQPILEDTFRHCSDLNDVFKLELRLIANQASLSKPNVKISAEEVDLTSIDPFL